MANPNCDLERLAKILGSNRLIVKKSKENGRKELTSRMSLFYLLIKITSRFKIEDALLSKDKSSLLIKILKSAEKRVRFAF